MLSAIRQQSVEAYTKEELLYIFDCIKKEPIKWQAFIRLLATTGIRRGEACALTWQDIDFLNGTITIAHSLNYTKDKGIYLEATKNGKQRVIYADADTLDLLKRMQRSKKILSRYVFTQDESAEPIFPQSPTRYFETLGRRYGIDHFHPHKLRHSFASIAITSGADIASVSEVLGHSDKAITLRVYAHADEESKKRASEIFNNALQSVREA